MLAVRCSMIKRSNLLNRTRLGRTFERGFRDVAGALVAAVGLIATGCGGPCFYQKTAGTARITAIQAHSGGGSCPNDGVEVLFDFTPGAASKTDLATTGTRLLVGEGLEPARSWVEASGLTVGSVHPATRSDETYGSCSPEAIILDDIDYRVGANACFGK